MAYDRYDPRHSPRDERWRWSENRNWGRERSHGDRDERGFFERAGDQIASWFGDEDSDREREDMRGRGGYGRDPDRSYRPTHWSSSDRDSRPSRREPWGGGDRDFGPERGYRPLTGDYGRSDQFFAASGYGRSEGDRDYDGPESKWNRDDYRRTSFAGSSARSQHHDPHYHEWRQRQIADLDRDYDEYRREHQSKFENEFGSWRERRQSKRQMLGSVREHMEVVGNDDEHVGTVDRVAGDRLIMTKSDPEAGGVHHSISCTDIDRIDGDRVILGCSATEARIRWRDESRSRALFEREDQGEAGPGVLDRSFSGTDER